MTGFTYNGVHTEDLGLYYIPTRDDLWFADPEFDVYDNDIDWRHGGVYYDSKAKVRTFTLKCYFEEIDVARRQAIKQWVKRGTSGMLVFDDMPFVYWNVRPGKIPAGNWCLDNNEKHSGTVTITFNAYEPFGYLMRKSNSVPSHETDGGNNYCSFIDTDDMPAAPTTSSTNIEIYNPGTEACGLTIDISGTTSNPIRFFNQANGTYCVFGSLPSVTGETPLSIRIDGDTGKCTVQANGGATGENGFAYHDKGVVRIEPNVGRSGVSFINGTGSGTEYQLDLVGYPVTNALKGAKVLIGNDIELTVNAVSASSNRVWGTSDSAITMPASGTCTIMTTNKIVIEEKISGNWATPSTLSLGAITVDYKPRAL